MKPMFVLSAYASEPVPVLVDKKRLAGKDTYDKIKVTTDYWTGRGDSFYVTPPELYTTIEDAWVAKRQQLSARIGQLQEDLDAVRKLHDDADRAIARLRAARKEHVG